MRGTAESYRVFVRNWWRWASEQEKARGEATVGTPADGLDLIAVRTAGPMISGLLPDPGARKTTIARHCTEEEARAICRRYAKTHKPGPLSRKAEYERE